MSDHLRATDLEIAREVRDEHANGFCNECRDGGPCPREAAWAPWIYVIEAREQRLEEEASWPSST